MSTQTISGKVVRVDDPITKDEAQKLDNEARRLDAKMYRDDRRMSADEDRLSEIMDRMQIGYSKVGFASFCEWAFDACPKIGLRKLLTRMGIARYEFAGALSDSGKSNRDIAAALGIDVSTVNADIRKRKQEKLDRLSDHSDELTNSDDEPEDVEPEPITPRPEARMIEGDTCAADGFDESYRFIREWLKPMLVNPEYQQAKRLLKFWDKSRNQIVQCISNIEAEERRRNIHIVA